MYELLTMGSLNVGGYKAHNLEEPITSAFGTITEVYKSMLLGISSLYIY